MKLVFSFVLVILAAALGYQLYRLNLQQNDLEKELAALTEKITPLETENKDLTAEIDQLQEPEILEMQLRKSGYAKPGEKMIIVVPKK